MTIHPLTSSDIAALVEFYESLTETVTRFFLPFGAAVALETLRSHLDGAEMGRNFSLGLFGEDRTMQGHAFLLGMDTESPVFGIGLRESIIGNGWGRRMMERTLAEGDALQTAKVTLTVVKENSRALALYKKLGFVVRSEWSFRTPNDSWYMERVIPNG